MINRPPRRGSWVVISTVRGSLQCTQAGTAVVSWPQVRWWMRAGGRPRRSTTGRPRSSGRAVPGRIPCPCRSRGSAHRGPLLVSLASEDIFLDEPGQPGPPGPCVEYRGPRRGRRSSHPGKYVTHDQGRPRVAEQVGGSGDRAGHSLIPGRVRSCDSASCGPCGVRAATSRPRSGGSDLYAPPRGHDRGRARGRSRRGAPVPLARLEG